MIFKREKNEKKTDREKLEERREEVLAQGRKFKYPLQYAKHKVVTLTILISVLVVFGLIGFGYIALYKMNSTDDLLYRLTQVLPVSVATVDEEKVRYSDYLLIYRSSITPVEKQQNTVGTEGLEAMRAHFMREALTEAEDYTYAVKLGKELGVSVSDAEVDEAVLKHRSAGGVERSEEAFSRILSENFGLSLSEYKRLVYLTLMKQKVSMEIDETARLVATEVEKQIVEGKSLAEIAESLGEKVLYEETGGLVDKMNVDGGRSEIAMTLEEGKVSGRFVANSGDGYYFVQLVEKSDNSVSYSSIEVPFNEFSQRVANIRKEGKVLERIKISDETVEVEEE